MAKRKKVANGKGMNLVYECDRCWVNDDYYGFYVELQGYGCNMWTAWVVKDGTQTKFHGAKWYAMQQAQEYILEQAGVPYISHMDYLEQKSQKAEARYLATLAN